jgi:hypothetical protein
LCPYLKVERDDADPGNGMDLGAVRSELADAMAVGDDDEVATREEARHSHDAVNLLRRQR